MTPGARVAAAIHVLDDYLAGTPVSRALTGWARANRYAGSKDRAAVRDHVYSVLRRRRSCQWAGGGASGRALMIGALRLDGVDPAELFGAGKYAPAALDASEADVRPLEEAPFCVQLDMPDWLWPRLERAYGKQARHIAQALRERAPVFLRANLARATRDEAARALAGEGISTRPHPLAASALEVLGSARRIAASRAYGDGVVELQDAASQAVVEALPLRDGQEVLDYCAGGGGKSLAMAARADMAIVAHDMAPERMRDLPKRMARAGAGISMASAEELQGRTFDLVLCDAPCSGSGSWRRDPAGKWALTPQRLRELATLQARILDAALAHVRKKGALAYVTCSLLEEENSAQVAAFLARHSQWRVEIQRQFTPLDGGDGFFVATLRRV